MFKKHERTKVEIMTGIGDGGQEGILGAPFLAAFQLPAPTNGIPPAKVQPCRLARPLDFASVLVCLLLLLLHNSGGGDELCNWDRARKKR